MFTRLNQWIDQFCARHRRFGIPNLMKYIVFGTAAVAILDLFTNGSASSYLYFRWDLILQGQLFRLVSFLFVPENGGIWLLISLYFYYTIGNVLEQQWGTGRFTIYFFSGALLSLLFTILYTVLSGMAYPLSGLGYVTQSMFFAFAMLYGDAQVLLLFIPIKVKWLAWFEAAMFAISIIANLIQGSYYFALLPVVALLNFCVYFSPYFRRKADQAAYHYSPQATKFRQAARAQVRKEQQENQQGYHHKCCVCGKTDTDYPQLAFRYCSKCSGYHCFCEEHIFQHVHFTEE